jgi:SPP1 gp7 family putative phage head morphogenesis protein
MFARDMKRRFNELIVGINKAIVQQDVFGLVNKINIQQVQIPGQGAFAFPRNDAKLRQFMRWLQEQVDKGLLEIIELQQVGTGIAPAWTNKYVYDSYKRGVMRARYEMKKIGMNIPGIEETGGIIIALSNPFHIDRLGVLYTRTFMELKGITIQMDTQISRILAQGLADGDNPRLLARKLIATINGSGMGDLGITDTLGRFIPAARRAEMLARTEIIRAHHLATIQEYRNWAVEGVFVKAEWATAGDERVCPRCAPLQGTVWTLDQIEKMIPYHPQCRCIALPFMQSLVTRKGILNE